MTERPIMFSAPMVRAILEGRESQTRRVLKPQPDTSKISPPFHPEHREGRRWVFMARDDFPGYSYATADFKAPYAPGDLLWVKEAYFDAGDSGTHYKADWRAEELAKAMHRWQSPLFMPRWASRITLRVTAVRVQRLQEISAADAIAEGCRAHANSQSIDCDTPDPRDEYRYLWNSLNAKRGYGWETNPWVVAITFERVQG